MQIRKVLLAEDDEDIQKVARISLQFRGGWEVALARNGEECLAAAVSDHPDLILLDCMMPKLDGYETCRRLKQDPALRNIPVIFLTAKSQETEIKKGLLLGAVGYLVKPFNPMSLAAEIMQILQVGEGPVIMQTTDAVFLPENILDSLPRGTLVTDLEWRVRYVNRTLLRALRCSAEDLLGEHLCSLGVKIGVIDSCNELSAYLEHLTTAPPDRAEVKMVEVRIPEKKIIRVAVQPYYPNGGERAGYLFMFIDFTRQGAIDEMKNVFVAEASHELRTPMTSIKGSLELLLGGYAGDLPADATELLEISLAAVDRLIRLINDLLDIAKIEAGEMVLHLERLNVADSIDKCIRSMRSLAEKHQVTISLDASENVSAVLADRDRLEQVVTNLLSNSLKYSPADGVVHVRVRAAADAVCVSVMDCGCGIPADQVDKVFDRFHQLEGAKKGTGLGLTITRALIEQHGGCIWVESDFGHGATFHFELPAIPGE